MVKRIILLCAVFLTTFASVEARIKCLPKVQSPPKLVNDFAEVLSKSTVSQLERRLVIFNDTTSTQITLVTFEDLCGYEASEFATELGQEWGVGGDKFDNGIVVLFKPKTRASKGQVFIATGYGLEGVLPDAIAKRIVENEMIPRFKQGQVEAGLLDGIQVIIDIVGGEYSAKSYTSNSKKGKRGISLVFVLVVIFFIVARIIGNARGYASRNNTGLWAALWLLSSSSRSHGGHFDNFGSGSGGFGGFGGGSFGGGGAGGSW